MLELGVGWANVQVSERCECLDWQNFGKVEYSGA